MSGGIFLLWESCIFLMASCGLWIFILHTLQLGLYTAKQNFYFTVLVIPLRCIQFQVPTAWITITAGNITPTSMTSCASICKQAIAIVGCGMLEMLPLTQLCALLLLLVTFHCKQKNHLWHSLAWTTIRQVYIEVEDWYVCCNCMMRLISDFIIPLYYRLLLSMHLKGFETHSLTGIVHSKKGFVSLKVIPPY